MRNKPLTKYDPNASRSRLAQPDGQMPNRNLSSIRFDHGLHVCHKRRFITTHMMSHKGDPVDQRLNQRIIAEQARYRRQQDSL